MRSRDSGLRLPHRDLPAPEGFAPAHNSPLIDAGNPAAPAPSVQDRDGLARVVDGDGTGGARRDIGAYEYQRRPPAVVLNGLSSGKTGQPLGYTSAGSSDPDRGDEVTYS